MSALPLCPRGSVTWETEPRQTGQPAWWDSGAGGALLYTERRPHTAAPAKAKMSRAVNSCHITQPANVMSSSDVTLRPSEYKNSEGYEKSLQVAALFRQRQAALINTLMFPLLFTGTAVHCVYDTERHVCEWSSKRS